jgi:choline dehydrogenase
MNSNRTFAEEALRLYAERPAKGPYTLAMGNSAIYVSLPKITSAYKTISDKVRMQIESGAETFLPAGTPAEVVAGYKAQLAVLANVMDNAEQPILESPFQGPSGGLGFLLKPVSRGTVMLNLSNHDAEPLIDYRMATNPIDLEVIASFVPFFRKYLETPLMKEYGARETQPGAAITSTEAIYSHLRATITGSFQHPCCTAAMLPRSKGGVVGPDLRVFGVAGLSVVDCSIMPTVPGTHTSATAYAIGEKVSFAFN